MTTMMRNDVYSEDEQLRLVYFKREIEREREREKWGKIADGYAKPKTSSSDF